MAGRAWHHYPLQRWAGFEGDHLQPEENTAPWLHYPQGLAERDLHRLAAGRTWSTRLSIGRSIIRSCGGSRRRERKPVKFGTCCSQVMALFLDIHTPKYKDKRQVIWIWRKR